MVDTFFLTYINLCQLIAPCSSRNGREKERVLILDSNDEQMFCGRKRKGIFDGKLSGAAVAVVDGRLFQFDPP